MTERFLIALDVNQADQDDALDLRTIFYLDRVLIKVAPQHVGEATSFLQRNFGRCTIYIDAVQLESLDNILTLLNHGAAKVFVRMPQFTALLEAKAIVAVNRLVVSLDDSIPEEDPVKLVAKVENECKRLADNSDLAVHVRETRSGSKSEGLMEAISKGSFSACYVSFDAFTLEQYAQAQKNGHIPVLPATSVTTRPDAYPESIPCGQACHPVVEVRS